MKLSEFQKLNIKLNQWAANHEMAAELQENKTFKHHADIYLKKGEELKNELVAAGIEFDLEWFEWP